MHRITIQVDSNKINATKTPFIFGEIIKTCVFKIIITYSISSKKYGKYFLSLILIYIIHICIKLSIYVNSDLNKLSDISINYIKILRI